MATRPKVQVALMGHLEQLHDGNPLQDNEGIH